VPAEIVQDVRAKPAFQRLYELLQLGRYGDVRREWLAAFPALPASDRLGAVQLAATWGLHQFAISGLAQLGQMDDLDLRFPIAFAEPVQRYAQSRQLDPALVLAIMRRESIFDPAAQSPVGARGLMQLMPATGRIIAAREGDPALQPADLLEPERNLAYGTAYLAKLLDDFNDRLIFAVAAYNAGPAKVRAWLQSTLTPVPGDVWVEKPSLTTRRANTWQQCCRILRSTNSVWDVRQHHSATSWARCRAAPCRLCCRAARRMISEDPPGMVNVIRKDGS